MPLILILVALVVFAGCQSPGKSVTDHFIKLTEIAEDSHSDCQSVASSLNSYLDLHGSSMKASVESFIKATPNEAEDIQKYSSKLHLIISRCKNPEMDKFKKRLSEIIL